MKEQKAIEVPTIRLSSDETRALMRASAAGKPLSPVYANYALADLGLMVKVDGDPVEVNRATTEAWKRVKEAARLQDKKELESAVRQLNSIKEESPKFALTPLGKSVARGVTVRMGAQ